MNANTALKINEAVDQAIRCGESTEDILAQVNRAVARARESMPIVVFVGHTPGVGAYAVYADGARRFQGTYNEAVTYKNAMAA